MSSRIRSALPYAIGLGVAVLLFVSASQIHYTPRPGQIGPDFWPKIAVALMLVYAVLVSYLGFLLASFLFLAAFMYLGRYRNHLAVWTVSAGLTVVIAFLFIRFAYVSLPRGEPPFDRFTDLVR